MQEDTRRQRGQRRLAELGDHPGGDAFLERMGSPMADWLVEWCFGDVHTRPGLTSRDRELLIVACLVTLGGCEPQVAAHIQALRAIDVPFAEIEETILQTTPYAGVPRAINALKVLRTRGGSMRAVRFTADGGEARIGRLDGDRVVDAGPAGPAGFVPTPDAWRELDTAAGPERALAEVRLLHPVVPDKIMAIGVNYRDHAEESELDMPAVPVVFAKWPSALIGPDQPIVVPREETRPDYEGEVAIVLGETVYRATPEQARAAVGGISVMHDVSGRRAQLETPLRQFTLGKSFDTFAPMGPCIASSDGVDLAGIGISTRVSGELMQESSTRNLIFSVVDLIVYLSQGMTLRAGDVIATGTPGGVGDSRDAAPLSGRRRRGRDHGRPRGHAAKPGHAGGLSRRTGATLDVRRASEYCIHPPAEGDP